MDNSLLNFKDFLNTFNAYYLQTFGEKEFKLLKKDVFTKNFFSELKQLYKNVEEIINDAEKTESTLNKLSNLELDSQDITFLAKHPFKKLFLFLLQSSQLNFFIAKDDDQAKNELFLRAKNILLECFSLFFAPKILNCYTLDTIVLLLANYSILEKRKFNNTNHYALKKILNKDNKTILTYSSFFFHKNTLSIALSRKNNCYFFPEEKTASNVEKSNFVRDLKSVLSLFRIKDLSSFSFLLPREYKLAFEKTLSLFKNGRGVNLNKLKKSLIKERHSLLKYAQSHYFLKEDFLFNENERLHVANDILQNYINAPEDKKAKEEYVNLYYPQFATTFEKCTLVKKSNLSSILDLAFLIAESFFNSTYLTTDSFLTKKYAPFLLTSYFLFETEYYMTFHSQEKPSLHLILYQLLPLIQKVKQKEKLDELELLNIALLNLNHPLIAKLFNLTNDEDLAEYALYKHSKVKLIQSNKSHLYSNLLQSFQYIFKHKENYENVMSLLPNEGNFNLYYFLKYFNFKNEYSLPPISCLSNVKTTANFVLKKGKTIGELKKSVLLCLKARFYSTLPENEKLSQTQISTLITDGFLHDFKELDFALSLPTNLYTSFSVNDLSLEEINFYFLEALNNIELSDKDWLYLDRLTKQVKEKTTYQLDKVTFSSSFIDKYKLNTLQTNALAKFIKTLRLPLFLKDGQNVFSSFSDAISTKSFLSKKFLAHYSKKEYFVQFLKLSHYAKIDYYDLICRSLTDKGFDYFENNPISAIYIEKKPTKTSPLNFFGASLNHFYPLLEKRNLWALNFIQEIKTESEKGLKPEFKACLQKTKPIDMLDFQDKISSMSPLFDYYLTKVNFNFEESISPLFSQQGIYNYASETLLAFRRFLIKFLENPSFHTPFSLLSIFELISTKNKAKAFFALSFEQQLEEVISLDETYRLLDNEDYYAYEYHSFFINEKIRKIFLSTKFLAFLNFFHSPYQLFKGEKLSAEIVTFFRYDEQLCFLNELKENKTLILLNKNNDLSSKITSNKFVKKNGIKDEVLAPLFSLSLNLNKESFDFFQDEITSEHKEESIPYTLYSNDDTFSSYKKLLFLGTCTNKEYAYPQSGRPFDLYDDFLKPVTNKEDFLIQNPLDSKLQTYNFFNFLNKTDEKKENLYNAFKTLSPKQPCEKRKLSKGELTHLKESSKAIRRNLSAYFNCLYPFDTNNGYHYFVVNNSNLIGALNAREISQKLSSMPEFRLGNKSWQYSSFKQSRPDLHSNTRFTNGSFLKIFRQDVKHPLIENRMLMTALHTNRKMFKFDLENINFFYSFFFENLLSNTIYHHLLSHAEKDKFLITPTETFTVENLDTFLIQKANWLYAIYNKNNDAFKNFFNNRERATPYFTLRIKKIRKSPNSPFIIDKENNLSLNLNYPVFPKQALFAYYGEKEGVIERKYSTLREAFHYFSTTYFNLLETLNLKEKEQLLMMLYHYLIASSKFDLEKSNFFYYAELIQAREELKSLFLCLSDITGYFFITTRFIDEIMDKKVRFVHGFNSLKNLPFLRNFSDFFKELESYT